MKMQLKIPLAAHRQNNNVTLVLGSELHCSSTSSILNLATYGLSYKNRNFYNTSFLPILFSSIITLNHAKYYKATNICDCFRVQLGIGVCEMEAIGVLGLWDVGTQKSVQCL